MVGVKRFLFVLVIFLAACTEQEVGPEVTSETEVALSPTPTPSAIPVALATPTPAVTVVPTATITPSSPEEPAAVEEVTIEAADGLRLIGSLYIGNGPEPRPAVILLHTLGSNREIWQTNGFAQALATHGYNVLALDMRGHGETGSAIFWERAPDDLWRAWNYLTSRPDVDKDRTAIVGASIGANLALITGAAEPAVKTVVLLSPGLEYRGVTTEEAMVAYGERPVLIVTSLEDAYPAGSSQRLEQLAQGEVELRLVERPGHGTGLFQTWPEVGDLILDWLDEHVKS